MPLVQTLEALLLKLRYELPVGRSGVPAPCLPQRDPHPNKRALALDVIRSLYSYLPQDRRFNSLAPIAIADTFPFWESYGLSWALPYLPMFLRAMADTELKKAWWGLRALFGVPIDKMKAFRRLFSRLFELPAPPEVERWREDGFFARNRIDGPNPLLLARVRSIDELQAILPISEEQYRAVMGPSRTLADDLAAGNLFVTDYRVLQRSLIPQTSSRRDSRWRGKYLPCPVALFCQRPGDDAFCELVPVAIYCDQKDAAAPNPLYLRADDERWMLAKTFVEAAEFNLQAMSVHLFRQHYSAEPFALTTRRQLSPMHPVYVLLEPHLAYTLAVNGKAFQLMNTPGSVFDEIYAGELCETRQIMITSYETWTMNDMALEHDLDARGVSELPREYPYRDDARLWLPVLERFVNDYLQQYYHGINDIPSDWELQAWARELQAPDGGNLRGLFAGDRLSSVPELARVLTQFLFMAGPGHAAVHYPQTDYFTYIPAFPGAPIMPPPEHDTVTPHRIIDTLPPVDVGADQFENNQIANYRYDRFGDYAHYPLGKVVAAKESIARLQAGLADIQAKITERNRTRARPYPYLLPSLVPNSINI
ncbi:MAG TPA: lipoxygenase family protein [Polyangia bacterium]|nr:lipoxygenase family protein [Polyangia bacterium]